MPYESRERQVEYDRVLGLTGSKYISLPELCLMVHQYNTGSSDELTPQRYQYHRETLQMALDNWKEELASTKDFDDAVKNLIQVTLNECKRYE